MSSARNYQGPNGRRRRQHDKCTNKEEVMNGSDEWKCWFNNIIASQLFSFFWTVVGKRHDYKNNAKIIRLITIQFEWSTQLFVKLLSPFVMQFSEQKDYLTDYTWGFFITALEITFRNYTTHSFSIVSFKLKTRAITFFITKYKKTFEVQWRQ